MGLQSDFTVGLAKEVAYGTAVAPSRFLEADASLKETITTVNGRGYRPGARVARADRQVITRRESSGDIELDVMSVGFGLLLHAFFGTSVVTQVGASAVYQQNHTLQTADFLPSFTVQQGIPRLGGAPLDAFTYTGAQCTDLEFTAKAGEIVQCKSTWVAKELSRLVEYAVPSYPASLELLTFVGASLSLGGVFTAPTTTAPASIAGGISTPVSEITLTLKNNLDTGGYNLGGAGKRSRPGALKGVAPDAVGGTLTAEYTDDALVAAYLEQDDVALVLNFAGTAEIDAGVLPLLQFAVPLIRLSGDVPVSNKGDVITVAHAFAGLAPDSGQPITAVYRSLDTAV